MFQLVEYITIITAPKSHVDDLDQEAWIGSRIPPLELAEGTYS